MSIEAREFLMSKNDASGGEIERQDNVDFFFDMNKKRGVVHFVSKQQTLNKIFYL